MRQGEPSGATPMYGSLGFEEETDLAINPQNTREMRTNPSFIFCQTKGKIIFLHLVWTSQYCIDCFRHMRTIRTRESERPPCSIIPVPDGRVYSGESLPKTGQPKRRRYSIVFCKQISKM